MATATNTQSATNLSESLLNTWADSLDRVCIAQKELENLLLQLLENQKESVGKLNGDITRIQEEQKKLIEDLREQTKTNLQKTFGQSASKVFDQFNTQLDEVSSRVQELTVKPYTESVNLINQSQEQFQQSFKDGLETQQKVREDITSQIKSTQKMYFDLYEANSKIALSLFK
jgi:hypothetical protein